VSTAHSIRLRAFSASVFACFSACVSFGCGTSAAPAPSGSGGQLASGGDGGSTLAASGSAGVFETGGADATGGAGGLASSAGGAGGPAAGGGSGGARGVAGSSGAGGNSAGGNSAAGGGNVGGASTSGEPPPLTGTVVAGTVKVTRATTLAQLAPGFAGFSFEKTHLTDGFFTADHAALIAMFKLLGPGIVRIGADDVNISVWTPSATFVKVGTTSPNIGTAEVDALADFLKATGWKAIYAVNMRGNSTPQTAVTEVSYVIPKLGASLLGIEIGNELNLYGLSNVETVWHSYAAAIHGAYPTAVVAGPGAYLDINFATPFIKGEAGQLGLVTHHYYRAAAGTGATLANLLSTDPAVVSQSQTLANSVRSNGIAGGYRWGEMNSYSSHGQAGVSDVLASALWGINVMLTTAQYGSVGVNFHGGGQNMDGNVCPTDAASCNRPFRYSPILEIDSRVSAAAPLYYGMLLVSQIGTGSMLATTASAGNVNFKAYTVSPTDGSTRVVLVNSDASSSVNASVDIGAAVASAGAVYLRGPSLTSLTGVTLAQAAVTPAGVWDSKPPYTLAHAGNVITVPLPPASAVLVSAN